MNWYINFCTFVVNNKIPAEFQGKAKLVDKYYKMALELDNKGYEDMARNIANGILENLEV